MRIKALRRRGLTVLVAGLAMLPLLVATPPPASAASACPDVAVFGVRGSGQNSGFGAQVGSFNDSLRALLLPHRSVQSIAVGYTAASVDVLKPDAYELSVLAATRGVATEALLLHWKAYHYDPYMRSVNDGITTTYQLITARVLTCPDERLVLAGYSQGAMVVHRLVNRFAAEGRYDILRRIGGLALIADPDRIPYTRTTLIGDPAAGIAGQGVASAFGSSRDITNATVRSRTISVCDQNDLVCDFRGAWSLLNAPSAAAVHTAYVLTIPVQTAAKTIANTVLTWPVPTPKTLSIGWRVGESLSYQLAKDVKASTPVEWRLRSGLPPGMTLSATGLLSGTPTIAGSYVTSYFVRAAVPGFYDGWIPGTVSWLIKAPAAPDLQQVPITTSSISGHAVWAPNGSALYFHRLGPTTVDVLMWFAASSQSVPVVSIDRACTSTAIFSGFSPGSRYLYTQWSCDGDPSPRPQHHQIWDSISHTEVLPGLADRDMADPWLPTLSASQADVVAGDDSHVATTYVDPTTGAGRVEISGLADGDSWVLAPTSLSRFSLSWAPGSSNFILYDNSSRDIYYGSATTRLLDLLPRQTAYPQRFVTSFSPSGRYALMGEGDSSTTSYYLLDMVERRVLAVPLSFRRYARDWTSFAGSDWLISWNATLTGFDLWSPATGDVRAAVLKDPVPLFSPRGRVVAGTRCSVDGSTTELESWTPPAGLVPTSTTGCWTHTRYWSGDETSLLLQQSSCSTATVRSQLWNTATQQLSQVPYVLPYYYQYDEGLSRTGRFVSVEGANTCYWAAGSRSRSDLLDMQTGTTLQLAGAGATLTWSPDHARLLVSSADSQLKVVVVEP